MLRHYSKLPGWRIITRTHAELELKDTAAVRTFFQQERPTHVVLAAARVGGIHANRTFQVEFLLDNLRIQNNVIEAAADFAIAVLKPGGAFVTKAFQGGELAEVIALLKSRFVQVKQVKPKASRAESSEVYLVATGFQPKS